MNLVFAGFIIFLKLVYNVIKDTLMELLPRRLRKVKDIKGQTVLITGAGSGLGRLLAVEFSKYSTCVVLVDINKSGLLHTEKLMERGSSVFLYECDVSDRKQVYELAKKVKNDAGKVDILVNNAGVVVGKTFLDTPDEMIEKTMGVNIMAHFWTCKAFLPDMMEQNSGHIVPIASLAGFFGCPKLADYSASKFAAVGFAESLMVELKRLEINGVKVTTVCPSFMTTGMFEGAYFSISKPLNPENVAKKVVEAVLEERDIVCVPGYASIMVMLKFILPFRAILQFAEDLGLLRAMDTFVGRASNNNSLKSQTQPIKAD